MTARANPIPMPGSLPATMFDCAVDSMILLDGDLVIRALNPAAERMLQWSAGDVVGAMACRQVLACRRDSPWFLSDEAHGACVCAAALRRAVPDAELLIRPRPGPAHLVTASGSPLPAGHDAAVLLVLRALAGPRPTHRPRLGAGSLRLDLNRREARVDGRGIHLTPMEFALLRYLLANRERVVPRRELLETVWQYRFDDGSDVVKVHIGSLRHALKTAGARGVRIANVYGVGYMLTEEATSPGAAGHKSPAPAIG